MLNSCQIMLTHAAFLLNRPARLPFHLSFSSEDMETEASCSGSPAPSVEVTMPRALACLLRRAKAMAVAGGEAEAVAEPIQCLSSLMSLWLHFAATTLLTFLG